MFTQNKYAYVSAMYTDITFNGRDYDVFTDRNGNIRE